MTENRLYEFRIEYSTAYSIGHNYHYYLAHDAVEALEFQKEMIEQKELDIQLFRLERKCPFANKWIDESDILIENLSS
tara:strand:+ start:74 stop:307 length:234 start_codon:yes stop_codon:yes gene_type:complete